jgi:hypothetical protein
MTSQEAPLPPATQRPPGRPSVPVPFGMVNNSQAVAATGATVVTAQAAATSALASAAVSGARRALSASHETPTPEAGLLLESPLPEARNTMAIREFTDSAGIAWRVWSTTPRAGAVYDESHKAGWLTFESAGVRKRLAPIPRGWEEATSERLELMCRAAEVVRRASGPSPLSPDPDAPNESDRPPDRGRPGSPDRP